MVLAALPLGLAIGLAVGMLGGGGSVLAVPVLVYLLDQDPLSATTASLIIVTAGALAGSLGHARAGRVCWRHAGLFTAAAVPGILAGTLAGEVIGGRWLLVAFAAVMLGAAYAMWRRAGGDDPVADAAGASAGPGCPPLRTRQDLAAGVAVGFLTGLLGVGGGFFIVPTLAILLAFSIRTAIGTSLAIITTTSLLALPVHFAAGRSIDPEITGAMTLACVVGAAGGAAIAGRVPQRLLARGFAGMVTAVATYLLVSSVFLGGPPTAT
jgi:uncharacterized protein